jgi:hypothetical protein
MDIETCLRPNQFRKGNLMRPAVLKIGLAGKLGNVI